jgi:hypothetical protein
VLLCSSLSGCFCGYGMSTAVTASRSLPTKQYDTVWLRLAITRLAMTLSRLSRVSEAPSHKQVIRGAHRGRKRVGRGRYMAERNGSVHGQVELQTLCDTRMQVFPSFLCPRAANATRYRGRRRHSMRYNCLAQGQETPCTSCLRLVVTN